MTNEGWNKLHSNYKSQDWVNKPSIFATQVLSFFPKNSRVLELGGALGQDSDFFKKNGNDVLLTDLSEDVLLEAKKKYDLNVQMIDISEPLPFEDGTFDVVYAHLSLHYFDTETTHKVFAEIYRVLKKGGLCCALFNSIHDPEYSNGNKIENYYFEVGGIKKRYFDTEEVKRFSSEFKTILLDDQGESYKDNIKGIKGLVRFVGKKDLG